MDAVQRKLAQIGRPARLQDVLRRTVDRIPLWLPALGLITGILIQELVRPPTWAWLLAGGFFAVATALAISCHRSSLVILILLASLSFLCAGALRMAGVTRIAPDDIRMVLAEGPRPACLRGRIVRDLRIDNPRESSWVARRVDPSTRFYLRTRQIQTVDGWDRLQGIVRVWVAEPAEDLRLGDEVQVNGWLDLLRPPTNPGQFDVAAYLLDQGVVAAVTVKSRQAINRLPPSIQGLPTRVIASIRQEALKAVSSDVPPNPQAVGLAQALLLGTRQDIDSRLYESFSRTGLLHYVSLSGMHFGIVMGIIWFLTKAAGLLRPVRAAVCAVAVAIFLLMVPATAPAIRAAILSWVFCAALILRRPSHPCNTLALAAIGLLLARPTQLFDVSWQLSFACMAGILVLARPIEEVIHEWTGDFLRRPGGGARLARRLARGLVSLLSTGLGAWLGSAGLVLYHFYSIMPLSTVWTIVVLPLVWVVMMLGLVKLVVYFLLPPLGPALGYLLAGSTDALIWTVHRLADLDFSTMRIGHIGVVPVILYYVLVVAALLAPFRRPLLRKVILIGLAVTVLAMVGGTKWRHTHGSDLRLTCLDVGHGQAIVVQCPGSKTLLFDAGSMYQPAIGTRIANPFLDYSGLSRVDAVVVSHMDTDHVNGLPQVLQHCRVAAVYADVARTQADLWQGLFEQRPPTPRPLVDLPTDWGRGVEVALLWPPADPPTRLAAPNANDLSAVLLIQFKGRRILLCSDIEQPAQQELLRRHPGLHVDVLVLPHHGSTKTLAPEFIERLKPGALVCTCSRSQYQQHQVFEPGQGYATFYTGRDGAVTMRVEPSGMIAVTGFLQGARATTASAATRGPF